MKDVVELTKKLVSMKSVSRISNVPITQFIADLLKEAGWQIEWKAYDDKYGVPKANIVAKLGEGSGGVAFCSHNDTVPGQEQDWPAFDPYIEDGKLYGRGSCDMKGPLAATLVSALQVDPKHLEKPIYIVVTADEELGLDGARFLAKESQLLQNDQIKYGIIAEPTSLIPVYSHKGFGDITVISKGRAAHSSTGLGESALIKAIPFLNALYEIDQMVQQDPSFMNDIYTPAHHAINLTVDSGEAALNVMAPQTIIEISVRCMPNSRSRELISMIEEKARRHGLEASNQTVDALLTDVDSDLVQLCTKLTGKEPETVPYGTDGNYLMNCIEQLVILGPGDIALAHTVGEYVPVDELYAAVNLYTSLIERLCFGNS